MIGSNFTRHTMHGMEYEGKVWSYTDQDIFDQITDCKFTGATFTGCSFKRVDMSFVQFHDCTFTDCDFAGAKLDGVMCWDTKFIRPDFRHAKLVNFKMYGYSTVECPRVDGAKGIASIGPLGPDGAVMTAMRFDSVMQYVLSGEHKTDGFYDGQNFHDYVAGAYRDGKLRVMVYDAVDLLRRVIESQS